MSTNNGRTCEHCCFYNSIQNQCRINPPVVVAFADGTRTITVWPDVSLTDWCGQWQSK